MHDQRVENKKTKTKKATNLLGFLGGHHFLSTADELPASVTMKHACASQDRKLQTSFSSGFPWNFQ